MLFEKLWSPGALWRGFAQKLLFHAGKIQFAEQLKLVFSKTSFQRKDHCLKGKHVVSDVFLKFGQVWAARTDVQLHIKTKISERRFTN